MLFLLLFVVMNVPAMKIAGRLLRSIFEAVSLGLSSKFREITINNRRNNWTRDCQIIYKSNTMPTIDCIFACYLIMVKRANGLAIVTAVVNDTPFE